MGYSLELARALQPLRIFPLNYAASIGSIRLAPACTTGHWTTSNMRDAMQNTRQSGLSAARATCAAILLCNQALFAIPICSGGDTDPIYTVPADFNGDQMIDGADLSQLLGMWGETNVHGDCTVDGATLANLLGGWGPVLQWTSLSDSNFENYDSSVCFEGHRFTGQLNGSLTVDKWSGSGLTGIIEVSTEFAEVSVEFADDFIHVVILSGESEVLIDSRPNDMMTLTGVNTPIGQVIDNVTKQWGELDPADWDDYGHGMMAMQMVMITPDMSQTFPIIHAGGNAPGFWCKAWCYSAGTIIWGLAAVGCASVSGSCALGTVVTVGGIGIPCALIIGFVCGGAAVTADACYEWVQDFWN
jgi:hypothetical protein